MPDQLTIPPAAQPFLAASKLSETMTCRQVAALLIIAANPGRSTGEIAESIDAPKPSITRGIAKMAALGFVRSEPHTGDRRLIRVSLTAAGRAALAKLEG